MAAFPPCRPLVRRLRGWSSAVVCAIMLPAIALCARPATAAARETPGRARRAASIVSATVDGTIVGRVTDGRSTRGIGSAIIRVDGARIGAVSGEDGRFRIAGVRAGSHSLVVRRTGYAVERLSLVVVDGQALRVDVVMRADPLHMDDLVVAGGMGESSRRQFGTDIGIVDGEEIRNSGAVAVDRALAGKVPGVMVQQNSGDPGGGSSVRFRGTNTIVGSADPLYVVDGVIVGNDATELIDLGFVQNRLIDISPEDVDHVEVVKGADAARYGARGNNGVVRIFTKHGTAGAPRFTWTSMVSGDQLRRRLAVNRYPFDAAGNPVTRYDHQDLIFRTGTGLGNFGSVMGGTAGTQYYVGGGYTKNEGIVRRTDFARTNGRARLDQTLADWASLSVGWAVSVARDNDGPNGLDGAIASFLAGPNTFDPRPSADGVYPKLGVRTNPVELIDRRTREQKTDRSIGDAHLRLTPLSGLTVDYGIGFDESTQRASGFTPGGIIFPDRPDLAFTRRGTHRSTRVNNDLNVGYARAFTSWLHSASAIGATWESENSHTFTIDSTWGASGTEENRLRHRLEGLYGQETFGLGERLYLTAAGRFDKPSEPASPHRWYFYPQLSASYLVSNEASWKGSLLGRLFPRLRLRGAWGHSGGLTAFSASDWFSSYPPIVASDPTNGDVPVFGAGRLQPLDIQPERQTNVEGGLDASVLSERVGVELSVYRQHTSDLIFLRVSSGPYAPSYYLANVGALDNRGVELSLHARPIATQRVGWFTAVTYSANRNEVSGLEDDRSWTVGSSNSVAVNGHSLGVLSGYGYLRDAAGRVLDVNGVLYTDRKTQVPAVDPHKKLIGNSNPRWIGSWINEATVGRDLSFHVQLDGIFGGDVLNAAALRGNDPVSGALAGYGAELAGEVALGTNTGIIQEQVVEDGSFVKLRELAVTYLFHPRLQRLHQIGVSLIGRNLLSFDRYSGYDPEVNESTGQAVIGGLDFSSVPIPRTVGIRVTTTF